MTAKRFDAEAYAASGLDFMTVSLDGATQSVYERFRKKGDLALAFENIRALVDAKRRLGKKRPLVSWQFLAFEHNAHEMEDALAIARQLGVDQFRVATPFDVSWDDPDVRPANVPAVTHEFRKDSGESLAENWNPFGAERAAESIEREFAVTWASRLAAAPAEARRDHFESQHVCHWLYKNMVMDATGRVIPCCAAPKPAADLVFAQLDGGDLFNAPKYQVARMSFVDKKAVAGSAEHPHCIECDWYGDQEAAQIDSGQVRNYLNSVRGVFDEASVELLSSW
jgi:MoaA/NifB/PqqE/SkfB family radical SAM enzyme